MEAAQNGFDRKEKKYDSLQYLKEYQLEALRSLARLLLREVESLQKTPSEIDETLTESDLNLLERTQRYEVDLIRAALIKSGGNQRKAAKILGTKKTTLNVKIKRYGIDEANQHSVSNGEKRRD